MPAPRGTHNPEAIKKAAEICGSLSQLARELNAGVGSVSKWANGKTVPSPFSCMKIEKVTKGKVRREDIRPDIDWKSFKF